MAFNKYWLGKPVQGLLLDITGVLYESGEQLGKVIPGSVEAIQKLRDHQIPFRLLTNESASSNESLIQKLAHHGYSFRNEEIFSPIPAMKRILKQQNLQPFVIVHPNVRSEFAEFDQSKPTCVVLGDADEDFSFANMNAAFNHLKAMKNPLLFSLGKGKFYRHNSGLQLDVGAFATALEFACDIRMTVIGKPSHDYFKAALDDLQISPEHVRSEFAEFDQSKPTCVVLGDADEDFSFANMNAAFNHLKAMKNPLLFSLGKGKFYRHNSGLQLDVGAFATALEFACDIRMTVIGKPSHDYFKAALDDLQISPEHTVMIGDDIDSDVGGSQKCGMRGVLVKTGKFTEDNLNHPSVKPDYVADNLKDAIEAILSSDA